jgi:hypothetical protein
LALIHHSLPATRLSRTFILIQNLYTSGIAYLINLTNMFNKNILKINILIIIFKQCKIYQIRSFF